MSQVLAVWAPLALAGGAALVALLADMTHARALGGRLAALVLAAAGSVALYAAWTVAPALGPATLRVGAAYSVVPGVVFILAALAVTAEADAERSARNAALVSLAALGASVAAVTVDLVATLVALEVAAVCGYALVSSARSRRSDEASMKYFVQGALATGLFVLGLAVLTGVFAADGVLDSIAAAIGENVHLGQAAALGVMALVAAVGVKAGAAPFHSWAPDAYETAPPASAAFLGGAIKLAMIAVLASVIGALLPAGLSAERPLGVIGDDLIVVVGGLAVLSIAIGSTVALTTRSYTRMLGYAGVAQVGYALIALSVDNTVGAVVFASTYAIATTAAFVSAAAFARLDPDWDGSVEGLAGMGHRAPALSAALTLSLMSLAGVPPLLGFWGKFQAFAGAVVASTGLMGQGSVALGGWVIAIVALGVIGSIVSLGYYGAVVRALYFGASVSESDGYQAAVTGTSDTDSHPVGGTAARVAIALAIAVVFLGIVPLVIGVPATLTGFTTMIGGL